MLFKKKKEDKKPKKSIKDMSVQEAKKTAIDKFTGAVDKEKAISRRITILQFIYEIVVVIAYTVLTFTSVFTKWDQSNNPLLITFLMILYVASFVALAIYTIRQISENKMNQNKAKATIKNVKSVSKIIKYVMKVISVGISILLTLEAWSRGGAFKIFALILLAFSVLSFLKAFFGIFKEIKTMKKRTKASEKESKVMTAKHKVEAFSDSLKEKNK